MTRVLVTGASGFIGVHLVEALRRRGDEVTCLVRPTSRRARLEPLGVRFVCGDVTDAPSLAAALDECDPQVVYHLAGLTRALRVARLMQVNAEGVCHLAGACARRAAPPTLLVVSSLAAAGPAPAGRPRTEADTPEPVSAYGRSKLAGEQAARRFAHHLPTTIVRPPIVFGPGDRDVWHLFRLVQRLGLLIVPGPADFSLALIHVTDLVEALVLAAERGERVPAESRGHSAGAATAGCGCYFVAGEQAPTLAQFAGLLAEAVGRRRVRTLHLPRCLARLAGVAGDAGGWLRRRPLTLGSDKIAEALAGSWLCATDKGRRQLGFAGDTPLAQRLRETAQWYRQHGWL